MLPTERLIKMVLRTRDNRQPAPHLNVFRCGRAILGEFPSRRRQKDAPATPWKAGWQGRDTDLRYSVAADVA